MWRARSVCTGAGRVALRSGCPTAGVRGCPLSLGSEACRRGRSAGRTPPPHPRRGQAQLLPALPGPLCDPRAASPWGGPPVLRPRPHLLRVGASSSRRCQGGDCPRLEPHPQPRAPGSATASTAREAPAHRPARLARGRGRDARVGRSLSGTVSGCWAFSWRGHCCFVPRGLLPDPPPCSSYPAPRAPPGACSAVRVSSGLQAALLSDAASLCRVPGGPALCCLC